MNGHASAVLITVTLESPRKQKAWFVSHAQPLIAVLFSYYPRVKLIVASVEEPSLYCCDMKDAQLSFHGIPFHPRLDLIGCIFCQYRNSVASLHVECCQRFTVHALELQEITQAGCTSDAFPSTPHQLDAWFCN